MVRIRYKAGSPDAGKINSVTESVADRLVNQGVAERMDAYGQPMAPETPVPAPVSPAPAAYVPPPVPVPLPVPLETPVAEPEVTESVNPEPDAPAEQDSDEAPPTRTSRRKSR